MNVLVPGLKRKVNTPQPPMLFSVDSYQLVVMPVAIGVGKREAEAQTEGKRKTKEPVPVA